MFSQREYYVGIEVYHLMYWSDRNILLVVKVSDVAFHGVG